MKKISPFFLATNVVTVLLLHLHAHGAFAFVAVQTTPSHAKRAIFCSFRRIRHSTSTSCPVLLNNVDQSSSAPSGDHNRTEILWSYVYNLQRTRREVDPKEISADKKNQHLKPAKSLAMFLSSHEFDESEDGDIHEVLSRAVVQAIRLSASLNDYRLILRLIDGVVHFAGSVPVVEPRILGEAIRALSSTSSSIGKIKSVWNIGSEASCWRQPIGPMEMNAMLEALINRGKIRAALDLYRQQKKEFDYSQTDPYSLSILFNGLAESILDDQQPTSAASIPELKNAQLAAHYSPCWQWNEALKLLDELLIHENSVVQRHVTNPVVSALLQLNDRAWKVYKKQERSGHSGSRNSLFVLEFLKEHRISPDTVTCTLLLSSLQTEWKVALELLRTMLQTVEGETFRWSLPPPNVYIYSAVMAVCARNQQYKEVWKLLDQVDKDPNVEPNTWVYNVVMQAVVKTTQKRSSIPRRNRSKQWMIRLGSERMIVAFQLLDRMVEGARCGLLTAPDTVTYNTVLSGLAAVASYLEGNDWAGMEERYPQHFSRYAATDWSQAERIVQSLLDQMEEQKIKRDAITTTHSLQALEGCSAESVTRILERSVLEIGHSTRAYNDALAVIASSGDVDGLLKMLLSMQSSGVDTSPDTTSHVIHALGLSGRTSAIPVLLDGIRGDPHGRHELVVTHGIDLETSMLGPLFASHYSAAISSCLLACDFESARKILAHMQANGVKPTESSLQAMARAYAVVALSSASKPKKEPANSKHQPEETQIVPSRAVARAQSAYAITANIGEPSASLLSVVSKACAATGLFTEAQVLLHLLHKRLLEHRYSETLRTWKLLRISPSPDENEQVLSDLHRTLLRSCAKWGNVTAALMFCEDIQYLSRQLSWSEANENASSARREPQISSQISTLLLDPQRYAAVEHPGSTAMKVPEWKSLLVAASKSGHWRVCLSTLQLLRPYLEESHPSHARDGKDRKRLSKNYRSLSPALTTAVTCLSDRSQYAWVVRVIDDWILWSGRRPPRQAVLAATRLLSSRGHGEEVNSLLTRCLSSLDSPLNEDSKADERILYVGAITTLYKDGLYDAADEVFVTAISKGCLPFNLDRQSYGAENRFTLDLHGMNVAVAHSAVRIALQQEVLSNSWNRTELCDNDIVIVTGRGRKSALQMRPVLRPEIQRMLVEEFYPPLSTTSVPGNMGALRVASEEINAWLDCQRQQKGARMLSVAAVLKNLSSGSRLKEALSRAAL
jgi:pentatricopeptide repeat protein